MSKQTMNLPDNPQIEVIKSSKTGLFTNYIYKAIPLAFDESMSYYETSCGLLYYLKNVIIPTVNNNADAVAELQNLYLQLHDYVENYFTNLDVQDEINNKLDQMVKDGTLQNILNNYTMLIKTYNTYNDLINDKNTFVNNQKVQTLGYYEINDGGSARYIVTNEVDENNYQINLENNLYLTLIVDNNMLNIMQVGCKGDGTTDDTNNLQNAFNIACDYNYVLFIPNKTFYISNSINIKSSINVKGDSNSNYKTTSTIKVNIGDENIEVFTAGRTPRCTFENIKIERLRTNTDGYPANVYAYGRSGICFGIDSNETVFNRVVVVGFGSVFKQTQITTCQECDFVYCNSIIKSNIQVSSVNLINCNCYSNGILFDVNAPIQNLNLTDSWIEDFVSLIKNYYKAIQNFNVTNCVLTNTIKGENYLVYDNTNITFSRQFLNFVNSVLYIKNNICDGKPSNTEFEMRLLNCSVLYGGTGETINIVGNSKFMNLNSQNITSLNTKGFDFSNNMAYNPIRFNQFTSLPNKTDVGETSLYYNANENAKRLEYFNNSLYRNIIPPVVINPNSDGSKPNFTPTCLTIAINQILFNGNSLGWIFHPTTNDWVEFNQIGQRSFTGNPVGNVTPNLLGETIFDTVNKNWYISTGTTNSDWKQITNI